MSGPMPRSRSAALTSSFFFSSRRNFGSIAASIASSSAVQHRGRPSFGDHRLPTFLDRLVADNSLLLRLLVHFTRH